MRTEAVPGDVQAALDRRASQLGPFGKRLLYFSEVSSTSDVAARLAAAEAPEGTTVLAGAQTAGRGRRGHTWFSPPDAGIYASIVFRSSGTSHLTLMGGVAVAEAIRASTGLPVTIKWPNDVVVEASDTPRAGRRRRKIAGILAEAFGTSSAVDYVILGFGINLRLETGPRELAQSATSVEAELGRPVDRAPVFVEALAALARWHGELLAGRTDAILRRWRALSPSSRGARVELTGPEAPRQGITEGMDREGALLVRVGTRVERIIAGEIAWL